MSCHVRLGGREGGFPIDLTQRLRDSNPRGGQTPTGLASSRPRCGRVLSGTLACSLTSKYAGGTAFLCRRGRSGDGQFVDIGVDSQGWSASPHPSLRALPSAGWAGSQDRGARRRCRAVPARPCGVCRALGTRARLLNATFPCLAQTSLPFSGCASGTGVSSATPAKLLARSMPCSLLASLSAPG